MDKQAITIDELIESLNACVRGDDCEKCIECENIRERFCWVNLMRKTAEVLEQLKWTPDPNVIYTATNAKKATDV